MPTLPRVITVANRELGGQAVWDQLWALPVDFQGQAMQLLLLAQPHLSKA